MAEDGGKGWRRYARYLLQLNRIKVVEPQLFEDYDFLPADIRGNILTDRDRRFAQDSEFMLVNLSVDDGPARGTCIELGWADACDTCIVTVLPSGSVYEHPMIRSVSDYITEDLDTALSIITALSSDDEIVRAPAGIPRRDQ